MTPDNDNLPRVYTLQEAAAAMRMTPRGVAAAILSIKGGKHAARDKTSEISANDIGFVS
jgi:hypothetical protein